MVFTNVVICISTIFFVYQILPGWICILNSNWVRVQKVKHVFYEFWIFIRPVSPSFYHGDDGIKMVLGMFVQQASLVLAGLI